MSLEGLTSTSNQCLVKFDLYPYSKYQWLLDEKAPQIIISQNIVILPSLHVPFFTDKHNYIENSHPSNYWHMIKMGDRMDQHFNWIEKLICRTIIKKSLEQKSAGWIDSGKSIFIDSKINAMENHENINCKSH